MIPLKFTSAQLLGYIWHWASPSLLLVVVGEVWEVLGDVGASLSSKVVCGHGGLACGRLAVPVQLLPFFPRPSFHLHAHTLPPTSPANSLRLPGPSERPVDPPSSRERDGFSHLADPFSSPSPAPPPTSVPPSPLLHKNTNTRVHAHTPIPPLPSTPPPLPPPLPHLPLSALHAHTTAISSG